MLNDKVKDRLLNWKFESARRILLDEAYGATGASNPASDELETVIALAQMFGDSGWFWGSMADVVRAAVWYLGVVDPEDEVPG